MSDIPRGVISEQLQERIAGRRVIAAIFLTFDFDPGFFEQEIFPILFNIPFSHAPKVRLVQIEEALRACAGQIAVFYDADRLVRGDGSAHLDVRRIPVRVRESHGVFHPKNVLLLVKNRDPDEEGHHAISLVVGALSANLTRSGWWENVEACHFIEISEGSATMMKEDLLSLLARLRRETPAAEPHEPLQLIRRFLLRTQQRVRRFDAGLHPQFFPGGGAFADFLEGCAGMFLRGAYLEIISPYLDATDTCAPLEELIERFKPKEVRVLLPRNRDGMVACTHELYQAVKQLKGVSWATMPDAMLRAGGAGRTRFVHAKVYRFFSQKPKWEIYFIGSVNLTQAAHHRGGNWESGLLVEVESPRMPEFWLEPESARPGEFAANLGADTAKGGGTPLMLRYAWDRQTLEAYWDAEKSSPALRLESRGVSLGAVGPLAPKEWTRLAGDVTAQVGALLHETSFVWVYGGGVEPGLLLVQEEGMTHKPSLLLNLTASEILRYWAMLTPEQRSSFVEAKGLETIIDADGVALVSRVKIEWSKDTFFDRFAGIFHAFSCLESEVRSQLADQRHKEAAFRLFGRKYDSLPTLLDRVLRQADGGDDVERYVILLCAKQLLQELSRDAVDFWREHRDDVRALEMLLSEADPVRTRLSAPDAKMAAFLDWFDERFLARAKPQEVEV